MIAAKPGILPEAQAKRAKPRLGFIGVGWIGRHRMEAVTRTGLAEIIGIADPVEANGREASKLAPYAERVSSLDELLEMDVDAVVIATPSALHAEQAIRTLESGAAVFCQKPLARTKAETMAVIEAARTADRLLGVDFSYRFTSGMQQVRGAIESGGIGKIFAANLVFHNAYGPDKDWFYDFRLAGGGCVIDLGIHLVDLALWALGRTEVENVSSCLFARGERLPQPPSEVEDYAVARIDVSGGAVIQLSCSWKLQAGCDAIIGASFYGTEGGLQFRNVNGSFYDFCAERFYGTRPETLASGSDEWGGRAATDWLRRLAEGNRYDSEIESAAEVAEVLDRIYGRA